MNIDQPQLSGELHKVAMVEEPKWQLMFDRITSARKSSIVIILIGPELQMVTKICKLLYSCSNNEAEYEALITRLELVESKNVKCLLIKRDSRLVIQQLKGEFMVKKLTLEKYTMKAQKILKKIQAY